ncbi:Phosphoinositide phospholipase C 2 [Acorus calamus]|uniref:Phosphoinositide phospholipase C n=1 Tax=Acorus calamus TaxID=4465 RepID=A0AAV9F9M7_ACOCL|nr:Phosphoinositide phospholipase C 2 [Acorus calamus]
MILVSTLSNYRKKKFNNAQTNPPFIKKKTRTLPVALTFEKSQFSIKNGIPTESPTTRKSVVFPNRIRSSTPSPFHFLLLLRSHSTNKQDPNNNGEEMSTYRVCFFYKRRFRQATAEAPEEVRELFERYSENGAMGAEQLQRFLVEVQGEEGVTREEAQAIIDSVSKDFKYLIRFPKKGEGSLGLDAFFRYLFGEANPPLSPSIGVHHDMTAPLSHYFIYTGHNSYLTGNQLSSDCSVVPITNALKRGVRGIELDMWPNARKNNVDILHGRTLTTPVELIKCLKSIKEHAFSASLYPVIITLEDHLTPDLQANVAEMVTQTFGDMLFYPKSDGREEFPSPEELKMRITLSTKPPKEYLESKSVKDKDSGSISLKDDDEDAWGKEVWDLNLFLEDEDKESFKTIVLLNYYMHY